MPFRHSYQKAVLDGRTEREWQDKHIVGSLNMPLQHLRERLDEVPRDRCIVVQCGSGYRFDPQGLMALACLSVGLLLALALVSPWP